MTKENIETVYGIACDVHNHPDGYPIIVFGGALVDDDDNIYDNGSFENDTSFWFLIKNFFKTHSKKHHHEK